MPHISANNSANFCDKTNQFFMSLNAVYFCSITTHGCSLVLGKQAKIFIRNYCTTVKSNIFLKMHFMVFRSTSNAII
jgi:hypothetical protein